MLDLDPLCDVVKKSLMAVQDDGMDTNDLEIPFDTSSIDVIQILDIANSMIQQGGMNQF
jgi:hypothetical protein